MPTQKIHRQELENIFLMKSRNKCGKEMRGGVEIVEQKKTSNTTMLFRIVRVEMTKLVIYKYYAEVAILKNQIHTILKWINILYNSHNNRLLALNT